MRLMPSSLRCFYRANAHVLWLMLLVGVISFGWFLIDGNVGINLADEGYLWYGIAALKAGMIPIRDFQSYDPGRYVWITAGSILFGDGLVGMRASCVLFTCIGVTCGALAARRLSHDWGFLFLIVLPLILWMAPRYKSFEQSIALIGVYAAIRLIEQPITRQFFFSGIFIGLMAFMGRNHGVYMVVAFSLVLLFLSAGNWKVLPRRILVSCAGILVGYLPQLLMWAFVPGYLNAYIAMLGRELTLGTNLAKVVPWPWLALSQAHDIAGFCNVIQCCFYVLLPMFLFIGLCVILFLRPMQAIRHPLLVAAMAVSLPYAHFTFSRPDGVHLAHSVPALLLGIVAVAHWLGSLQKRALLHGTALLLFLTSLAAVALESGLGQEAIFSARHFVPMTIREEEIHVHYGHVGMVRLGTLVANKLAKPDELVAFISHIPGLYPVTKRLSPLKQLYFIWPALPSEEEAIIGEFKEKEIKWVLLHNEYIDRREDLYFHNTHPKTFKYIMDNYEMIEAGSLFKNVAVFRLRDK